MEIVVARLMATRHHHSHVEKSHFYHLLALLMCWCAGCSEVFSLKLREGQWAYCEGNIPPHRQSNCPRYPNHCQSYSVDFPIGGEFGTVFRDKNAGSSWFVAHVSRLCLNSGSSCLLSFAGSLWFVAIKVCLYPTSVACDLALSALIIIIGRQLFVNSGQLDM